MRCMKGKEESLALSSGREDYRIPPIALLDDKHAHDMLTTQ